MWNAIKGGFIVVVIITIGIYTGICGGILKLIDDPGGVVPSVQIGK